MKRFLFFLLVSAAACAGAAWHYYPELFSQQAGTGGRRAAGGGEETERVPVLVAAVAERDVPVYRDGIGNVQAYSAVTARAQVDGKLIAIEFKEGQEVRKGDVLARIDPAIYQAQYDQARAKKAQNQANLANMRIDLERYERLAATNAGSKQQADGQRAMVAQIEAQVRADQAAIDNAKVYLDYTTVTAPIDGRTGLRLVDAGSIIRASDVTGIVNIAQVTPIVVLFTLPQRDFTPVREAMAAGTVKVAAMEADGRTVLDRGTLEVVDNLIDTSTGTFKLKAVFANADMRLWPGQFVTARVQVATLAGVKVIPVPALRRGPEGPFVYTVAGGKALVQLVKVALQDDEIAVVSEGLAANQLVVTTGFARLSDGKSVTLPGPVMQPRDPAPPIGQNSGDQPASGAKQRS